MTDFYTQRLNQARQEKQASMQRQFLPYQKPEGNNPNSPVGNTMAGRPTDPNAKNQIQDSPFKTAFDTYTQDESFKAGMEEFATIMEAMKRDLNGIELPPEVLQKRVAQVVDRYKNTASAKTNMANQAQNAMGQAAPAEAQPMPMQQPQGAMING